jgi:hypothetical protein
LIFHLQSLEDRADVLVVDGGSGMNAANRMLWQHAALVLVVTTSDDLAVMDAYATIKAGLTHAPPATMRPGRSPDSTRCACGSGPTRRSPVRSANWPGSPPM